MKRELTRTFVHSITPIDGAGLRVELVTVTVRIVRPWWLPLYIEALKFSQFCGVLVIDPEAVGEFIGRHIRVSIT